MIALYIVAIVVVCGLVVFYFCWVTRKRKKTLERMGTEQPKKKKHKKADLAQEVKNDLEIAEKQVIEEEKKIEAELVDFSLDGDSKDGLEELRDDGISYSGELDFSSGIDESLFESKIEDYERFLQAEQENYVNEEMSQEEQSDINALMNFNFDDLKGKTREEVSDMIKDLSPAVQDFILNDIFERKNSGD